MKNKQTKKNPSPFRKLDHGIWSRQFMANRWGNNGNNDDLVLNLKSVALKMK